MKIYNKLVRDRIPEIMGQNGAKAVTRILTDSEYNKELLNKLQEELKEYLDSENIEELADLQEVIYSILKLKGKTLEEFEKIRLKKSLKKGSFDKRIFLEKEI